MDSVKEALKKLADIDINEAFDGMEAPKAKKNKAKKELPKLGEDKFIRSPMDIKSNQ